MMLPLIEKSQKIASSSRYLQENLSPPFVEEGAPEDLLREVVEITDRLAAPFRNQMEGYQGDCGLEGPLVYRITQALKSNYPLESKAVNLWMLEHLLRGDEPETVAAYENKFVQAIEGKIPMTPDIYPEAYQRTFGPHAFCLLEYQDRIYAIDTTFGQFFPEGTDDPLAQSIIDNGYFELTPENLNHYGRITSDPDYVDNLLPEAELDPKKIFAQIPLAVRDLSVSEAEMAAYLDRY